MDTKAAAGLVVAVVVLGGGVWYFASHAPSSDSQSAAAGQVATADTGATGSGSIAALMARGGDFQCTVNVVAAQTPTAGTIEVSGGKMHGAFAATVNGATVNAYMVNDGAYVYSWSDAAPQGVKVAVTPAANGAQAQGGFDPNTNVDYSCSPWTPDPSVFVPPANVTFMTFPSK